MTACRIASALERARLVCRRHPVMVWAVGVGIICSILAVLFLDDPSNDAAFYYARMAGQIKQGNWPAGFFHMIPPLVPLTAGLVSKLGLSPFAALKLVSCAFFLAGLWSLYRLLRRMVSPKLAEWGCLFYVICPRMLRYGTRGLLESAKVFFLLLLADSLLETLEGKRAGTITLGVSLGCLGLARGEGIFFALPVVPVLLMGKALQFRPKLLRGFLHGVRACACSGLIALLIWTPWLVYEFRVVGVPCLDSRQVHMFDTLRYRFGGEDRYPGLNAGMRPKGTVKRLTRQPMRGIALWMENIRQILKGLYPIYFWLAVAGISLRYRRKELTGLDAMCAGIVIYNLLLFLARGSITKRYISSTIPFLLPWSVSGGFWVLEQIKRLPWMSTAPGQSWQRRILVFLALVLVLDGIHEIRSSWPPGKNIYERVGYWIRENRSSFDVLDTAPLLSKNWGKMYHSGQPLVIASTSAHYALYASADLKRINDRYTYPYEVFVRMCRDNAVDLVIADASFSKSCPGFSGKYDKDFDEATCPVEGVKIYLSSAEPQQAVTR